MSDTSSSFLINKHDKLVFFFTQADDSMDGKIDAHIHGDIVPLVRAMCRVMDAHPECQRLVLSAAATYLREHGSHVYEFKILAGL